MSDKNESTDAANPDNEKNPENTSKHDSSNPAVPDGDTESVNTPLLTEPMKSIITLIHTEEKLEIIYPGIPDVVSCSILRVTC
ncbi:MAG: hypothetical protein IPG39_16760 [Bacteroidetes bacterium]|nr:hypothetical protein [Bacteroidota bacterium]